MSESPLLSVLIPVYNGERYLAECIESVLRQLWQPLEIVVVDDGSEDHSAAVAERFGPPVQCIRHPHRGLPAARNTALATASGGYVLHLDADDLLTSGSIAVSMEALTTNPRLDMVVGHASAFFSPDMDDAARSRMQLPAAARRGHISGTSIIRTEVFRRVGEFDESLRACSDLDWFMRATEAGSRVRFLSDVVIQRRIHGRNMSLTMKNVAASARMRVLKASLDRRRRATRETSE